MRSFVLALLLTFSVSALAEISFPSSGGGSGRGGFFGSIAAKGGLGSAGTEGDAVEERDLYRYGGDAPGGATEENCAGEVVGGGCWYLANGVSCDSICSTHGGYNEATRTYAGPGGTDDNCVEVGDAIGMTGTTVTTVDVVTGTDGWGCMFELGGRLRHEIPTNSTAANGSIERACACNE